MVPITTAIATEERLNTSSTLPPSLVNVPVLGTTMPSSSLSSSSSVFGSTILKVALALPESGSVKYASKECSPSEEGCWEGNSLVVWIYYTVFSHVLILAINDKIACATKSCYVIVDFED